MLVKILETAKKYRETKYEQILTSLLPKKIQHPPKCNDQQ